MEVSDRVTRERVTPVCIASEATQQAASIMVHQLRLLQRRRQKLKGPGSDQIIRYPTAVSLVTETVMAARFELTPSEPSLTC